MRIRNNMPASFALRCHGDGTRKTKKTLEKLSSGLRINRAGDDAAGLSISEKMRASITGLAQASENARDGISAIQIAEGALDEVHDMLNRMTELADQSMNGTYSGADRKALDAEYQNLVQEIDRIAQGTSYGKIKLLDGSLRRPPSEDVSMVLTRSSVLNQGGAALVGLDDLSATATVASVAPRDAAPAEPVPPTSPAVTISAGSDFTISSDGVYEIADGFTGTIHIEAGKKVLLKQATPATKLENVSIVCGAGTELNIENLNIENSVDKSIIDFTGAGNKLNVLGDNRLVSMAKAIWQTSHVDTVDHAVVHVGTGAELGVFGDGKLQVQTAEYIRYDGSGNVDSSGNFEYGSKGAGIGGDNLESCGKLSIYNSSITAFLGSGSEGAAIGGGNRASGGDITIAGGHIVAKTAVNTNPIKVSSLGACIGGGYSGNGGNITVMGGEIEVEASGGAGIGSGECNSAYPGSVNGGTIIIKGGTVTATGDGGAGIGGGSWGDGGNISISSSANITVVAAGGGAGIGGGICASSGNITVSGGTISALTNDRGSGIGNGATFSWYDQFDGYDWPESRRGTIQITGGSITANTTSFGSAIGNGGLNNKFLEKITNYSLTPNIIIDGGSITASSSDSASGAAIGGGGGCFFWPDPSDNMYHTPPTDGANLTINSGTVTVTLGWIGGGKDCHDGINQYAPDGTLTVNGGVLNYTDSRVDGPHHPSVAPPDPPTPPDPPIDPDTPDTPDTPDDPNKPTPPDFSKGGLILHIGEDSADHDYLHVYIDDMHADALGLTGTNVLTQESAAAALDTCKAAINQVSLCRASLGAYQNRLEHTINNLGVAVENTTSARALIRDADMADEIMTYTKQNILSQSSQAMLAQAMQRPESVLQLMQ